MKLYYSPGTCSLSSHIALREAGLAFDAVKTPTKTHKTPDGTDFHTINPLGYVPFLVLDSGETLRESAAILQYVADQVPEKQLAPPNGSMARYELQSWLSFIGTELHKNFAPLFNRAMPEEAKAVSTAQLTKRLAWVDGELKDRAFLLNDQFTVADGYLFNVTNWAALVKMDISGFKNLVEYRARVAARPAVAAAMKAEGLV